MHVLVTGANGFVGRHLVRELTGHDHQVSGLIEHGGARVPNIPCYPVDIRDLHETADRINAIQPEACIHLAGVAFVPSATKHPKLAIDVNFTGAVHILQAFREHARNARILMVTSSEIYGREFEGSVNEDASKNPSTIYGITKLSADLSAMIYAKQYGMSVMTARPENHIGPGQSLNFVTSAFAEKLGRLARTSPPHQIKTGNLESLRDFTDVRDVVRAYRLLVEKGRSGEAYNIASGKLRPIREILDGLIKIVGINPEIETDSKLYRPTDSSLQFDTRKIQHDVAWKAEIQLEQTLQDVYQDIQSRII